MEAAGSSETLVPVSETMLHHISKDSSLKARRHMMTSSSMLQLREYTKELRSLVTEGVSDEEISSHIQQQMSNIYRIVGICLGIPPDTFTWEYYNKAKELKSIGQITPLDFYVKHVKPYFNVDEKVSTDCFAARQFH
jgi:aminopeptidase C